MTTVIDENIDPDKTMQELWSRVRQRGDLPGFSKVVRAIVGAMRGDEDSEFNITKTVLSDPALTQRVLRLANSAMYSVFGQSINTVSRAAIVLGTEAIGHLALGLKLIEGLSSASKGVQSTRSEMECAVLAGHIARQVASHATSRDAEEAVVCSMLHSLGRVMLQFYMPEAWDKVGRRSVELSQSENEAAIALLGLSVDDLGREVARHWSFPPALIESMQEIKPELREEPLDHTQWLASVATMSSQCAKLLCSEEQDTQEGLQQVAESYSDMLGIDAVHLVGAVNAALTSVSEDVMIHLPVRAPVVEIPVEVEVRAGKPLNALQQLQQGVIEVRDASDTASTGQLMSMALEVIYKSLGFSRAIMFLRNRASSQYAARMCFGEGAQDLLPELVFPDAYQPDVFHAALASDKMIFVENAHDARFISKLPRWWKLSLPAARGFMVLPLVANRHPLGFIYGDWDMKLPHAKIDMAEIVPLDELRHLLVLAIQQKQKTERRVPKAN